MIYDDTLLHLDEDINITIQYCTLYFYNLNKYTIFYNNNIIIEELIIKYNRDDIYNSNNTNINKFYRYIHLYNNNLTEMIKQTKEYNDYIVNINNHLLIECNKSSALNSIIKLIEYGADIYYRDNNSRNALHYAAQQENNIEVIKYLIYCSSKPSYINVQTNKGNSALHIASYLKNNIEVIKYLVEQDAFINLQNNTGMSALHTTITQTNDLQIIKYLVEQGAYIKICDINGKTILHYASEQNNLEVVKYLVEYNKTCNIDDNYINVQDIYGNTALHYTSLHTNNLTIFKYLVEHGANVNIQNKHNKTPLYYAGHLLDSFDYIKYLLKIT